ncbi:hypothetical protein DW155_08680 [Lactococcus petauri]|nr:hypothetical protein YA68_03015 [Lactococcus garvieae]RGB57751.1 hypothetical protein DW155_08680 [Lactococcus petauri]
MHKNKEKYYEKENKYHYEKKSHNNLFKIKINTIIGSLRKLFQHMGKKKLFLLAASHIRKRSFRDEFLKHQ